MLICGVRLREVVWFVDMPTNFIPIKPLDIQCSLYWNPQYHWEDEPQFIWSRGVQKRNIWLTMIENKHQYTQNYSV